MKVITYTITHQAKSAGGQIESIMYPANFAVGQIEPIMYPAKFAGVRRRPYAIRPTGTRPNLAGVRRRLFFLRPTHPFDQQFDPHDDEGVD